MATARDELHALVDQLPASRADDAARLLRALIAAAVPDDDEPETQAERAAVDKAKREIADGKGEPWEKVRARLLGGG